MTEARPPLTLEQQADFIDYLLRRGLMIDGEPAKEHWMLIEGKDRDDLEGIAARLRRMVPHEAAIKRLVVGK